eukprot:gene7825-8022_t
MRQRPVQVLNTLRQVEALHKLPGCNLYSYTTKGNSCHNSCHSVWRASHAGSVCRHQISSAISSRAEHLLSAVDARQVAVQAAAEDSTDSLGHYDYDVFVIGGGSGGVRTARTAADHGARVALVELPLSFISSADKGGVGGTCVLRGCVPKKLMLYASAFAPEVQASKGFGSGVELLEGRGQVVDPHTVEVDGKKFTAKNIVVATGGQSSGIPIPGAQHAISSDKVLELDSLPKKVTLIGGGYIGMEFAGMFARLGCEVHVVARQKYPLVPRFDEEVCQFFMQQCEQHSGIQMHMVSNPTVIIKEPDGSLTVRIEPVKPKEEQSQQESPQHHSLGPASSRTDQDGSTLQSGQQGVFEIRGNDQVVLAVGRGGKTKGLGPKGSIQVDEHSRTNVPSIWAVGDVTSRIALTPVAIMEGHALGKSLATGQLEAPCYDAVPSACFSWPFVATVGLSEQQAAKKGLSFEVYIKTFTPLKATMAAHAGSNNGNGSAGTSRQPEKGLVKLLVECGSGRLLGLHMVGEDAPEIMQGYALALKMGATKQQLDSLVGIHPTAAEELLGLKGPTRVMQPDGKSQKGDESSEKKSGGNVTAESEQVVNKKASEARR